MPCKSFEDYMSPMAVKRENPSTFMRDAVEAQNLREAEHARHEAWEKEYMPTSWEKRESFSESALEPGLSTFESSKAK
jgi:hypothetical protein